MLSTDIIDFAVDPVSGDVIVNPLTGTSFTSGITGIAQWVTIRLRLFLGEWALNLDAGTDWNSYLGEKENLVGIRGEIARVVLSTSGIVGMSGLSVTLSVQRALSINFTAQTLFGDVVISTQAVPNG